MPLLKRLGIIAGLIGIVALTTSTKNCEDAMKKIEEYNRMRSEIYAKVFSEFASKNNDWPGWLKEGDFERYSRVLNRRLEDLDRTFPF